MFTKFSGAATLFLAATFLAVTAQAKAPNHHANNRCRQQCEPSHCFLSTTEPCLPGRVCMGARRNKDGPSATCYPTGVAAVPVEILEASMPILFSRKELHRGTGGNGATRGGDGQIISFNMKPAIAKPCETAARWAPRSTPV